MTVAHLAATLVSVDQVGHHDGDGASGVRAVTPWLES